MVTANTRMGLIEYIGGKIASFTITFNDGTSSVNRLWAAVDDNTAQRMVKKRRWLPEDEANFYNRLSDFRLLRWGDRPQRSTPSRVPISRPPPDSAIPPEPEALPLHMILQRQAEAMLANAPQDAVVTKEMPKPEFVISSSGMAHRSDCAVAKRIKDPAEFYTVEDVVADARFKKWHSCAGE